MSNEDEVFFSQRRNEVCTRERLSRERKSAELPSNEFEPNPNHKEKKVQMGQKVERTVKN